MAELSEPISLELRQAAANAAEHRAEVAAQRWLEARVRGLVTRADEDNLGDALQDLKRARRRLDEARRRSDRWGSSGP